MSIGVKQSRDLSRALPYRKFRLSIDLIGIVEARVINVVTYGRDEEAENVEGRKKLQQSKAPDKSVLHLCNDERVLKVVKRYVVIALVHLTHPLVQSGHLYVKSNV